MVAHGLIKIKQAQRICLSLDQTVMLLHLRRPLITSTYSIWQISSRIKLPTSSNSYGSKVLGPETGIFYNNQMDNLSTPNTSNQFGVPASPANYIAPGKRPVSSMSPLIIWDNAGEHVKQVLGGSGGPRITTSVAQVAILNWLFNQDIKIAIDSPRLHSQLLPEEVEAESGFDAVSTYCSIQPLTF